jgi:hypothetical protein
MEQENNRQAIENDRQIIENDRQMTVYIKLFIVKLLAVICLPFLFVLLLLILSILAIMALIAGFVFILFRFGQ